MKVGAERLLPHKAETLKRWVLVDRVYGACLKDLHIDPGILSVIEMLQQLWFSVALWVSALTADQDVTHVLDTTPS